MHVGEGIILKYFLKMSTVREWARFDGIGQRQWRAVVNTFNKPPSFIKFTMFLNPQVRSFKRSCCMELFISDFIFIKPLVLLFSVPVFFIFHRTV